MSNESNSDEWPFCRHITCTSFLPIIALAQQDKPGKNNNAKVNCQQVPETRENSLHAAADFISPHRFLQDCDLTPWQFALMVCGRASRNVQKLNWLTTQTGVKIMDPIRAPLTSFSQQETCPLARKAVGVCLQEFHFLTLFAERDHRTSLSGNKPCKRVTQY